MAACRAVLDDDECARADAFRTGELASAWIAAHALVRTALAAHGGRPASAWRFRHETSGRPRLVDAPRGLDVALSHAGPHAAVLVATGAAAIGVDLERADPAHRHLAIARRSFSAEEHALLAALPEVRRTAAFATLWTVKEAVLKARGTGLAGGLSTVRVALDAAGRVTGVEAEDGPWWVRAWEVRPGLHAALALAGALPSRIVTVESPPLGPPREAPELGPPDAWTP